MLLPGLVSGFIVAVILVLNGSLILSLVSLMQRAAKMQSSSEQQAI
jgi:hypothetical protein